MRNVDASGASYCRSVTAALDCSLFELACVVYTDSRELLNSCLMMIVYEVFKIILL